MQDDLKKFMMGWLLIFMGAAAGVFSVYLSYSKWSAFGIGTSIGGLVLSVGAFVLLSASFVAWEFGRRTLSASAFLLWGVCVVYELMGISGYLRTAQQDLEAIAYAESAAFKAAQDRVEKAQERAAELSAYAVFDDTTLRSLESEVSLATAEFSRWCSGSATAPIPNLAANGKPYNTRCNEAAGVLRALEQRLRAEGVGEQQATAYRGAQVEIQQATAALAQHGNAAVSGEDAHVDPMFRQWAETVGWIFQATPAGVKAWSIFGMALTIILFSALCLALGTAIIFVTNNGQQRIPRELRAIQRQLEKQSIFQQMIGLFGQQATGSADPVFMQGFHAAQQGVARCPHMDTETARRWKSGHSAYVAANGGVLPVVPEALPVASVTKQVYPAPRNTEYSVLLGNDATGNAIVADMLFPHLLVAGSSGMGKSNFLNNLILQLISECSPQQAAFALFDGKNGIEFGEYEKIPHLAAPVAETPAQVSALLDWVITEMNNRQRAVRDAGYKKLSEWRAKDASAPPYLFVFFDEIVAIIQSDKQSTLPKIRSLLSLGRSAGICCVLATQYPKSDILPTDLTVNCEGRVAFRLKTAVQSRVVIDDVGAEALENPGDFIFTHGKYTILGRAEYCDVRKIRAAANLAISEYGEFSVTPLETNSAPHRQLPDADILQFVPRESKNKADAARQIAQNMRSAGLDAPVRKIAEFLEIHPGNVSRAINPKKA